MKEAEKKLDHRSKESRVILGTLKYHRFVPLNKEELMVYPISSGIGENHRIRKGHISNEPNILYDPKHIKQGEYVGCIYNREVWHRIMEECCEEFDDFIVNFLHSSGSPGTSFYYHP